MSCSLSGLGCAAAVNIACSGCGVTIDYSSSAMCDGIQRHNVVSVAQRLAAFISGIGFAGYHKLFQHHLGMNAVTDKHFYRVIEKAYPHVVDILDEVCELGKTQMKSLPSSQLGSWDRAVTTSDGCWQIRGFFSQNSTFIIHNGALLWYGHASMRGCDSIIEDNLYLGTAKSAEGYLAAVLFQKAKEDGCKVEVNWQDQDSSSEKSFHAVFGLQTCARLMKCGGHVGRHALKEMKSKEFTAAYKSKHGGNFPEVATASCCCKKKRHSAKCGCLAPAFIESAKRNLFCAISQCGNDAEVFAKRMRNLGKYHARGIHEWDGGECDFHPAIVCLCGECPADEERKCDGKPYESQNILTCELHALAYEIECCH